MITRLLNELEDDLIRDLTFDNVEEVCVPLVRDFCN